MYNIYNIYITYIRRPLERSSVWDHHRQYDLRAVVNFCFPKLQNSSNLEDLLPEAPKFVKSRGICKSFLRGELEGGKANPTLTPAKAGHDRPKLVKALLLQNLKLSSTFASRNSKIRQI